MGQTISHFFQNDKSKSLNLPVEITNIIFDELNNNDLLNFAATNSNNFEEVYLYILRNRFYQFNQFSKQSVIFSVFNFILKKEIVNPEKFTNFFENYLKIKLVLYEFNHIDILAFGCLGLLEKDPEKIQFILNRLYLFGASIFTRLVNLAIARKINNRVVENTLLHILKEDLNSRLHDYATLKLYSIILPEYFSDLVTKNIKTISSLERGALASLNELHNTFDLINVEQQKLAYSVILRNYRKILAKEYQNERFNLFSKARHIEKQLNFVQRYYLIKEVHQVLNLILIENDLSVSAWKLLVNIMPLVTNIHGFCFSFDQIRKFPFYIKKLAENSSNYDADEFIEILRYFLKYLSEEDKRYIFNSILENAKKFQKLIKPVIGHTIEKAIIEKHLISQFRFACILLKLPILLNAGEIQTELMWKIAKKISISFAKNPISIKLYMQLNPIVICLGRLLSKISKFCEKNFFDFMGIFFKYLINIIKADKFNSSGKLFVRDLAHSLSDEKLKWFIDRFRDLVIDSELLVNKPNIIQDLWLVLFPCISKLGKNTIIKETLKIMSAGEESDALVNRAATFVLFRDAYPQDVAEIKSLFAQKTLDRFIIQEPRIAYLFGLFPEYKNRWRESADDKVIILMFSGKLAALNELENVESLKKSEALSIAESYICDVSAKKKTVAEIDEMIIEMKKYKDLSFFKKNSYFGYFSTSYESIIQHLESLKHALANKAENANIKDTDKSIDFIGTNMG